jgi:hypothetical protein
MNHIEPKVSLDALDPGRGDPGYWGRFQAQVMSAAGPELTRRRRARVTMGDVMLSWSRLVVPFAVTAAAAAALVLVQPAQQGELEEMAGLEEYLRVPLDGAEPLPAFLHTDAVVDRDLVLFAVEGY